MLWIEKVKQLSEKLEEPYALEFVYRGLHELTKLDWLNLMREEIRSEQAVELIEIAERLNNHEPPQYIVGWAEFCDLRFKVDVRVLIPRPETEELVQMILSENGEAPLNLLDIGTGSGAIAISLAKARPNWNITAADISPDALDLARHNAELNEVKLEFIQSDVLDEIDRKFDLIVSNPPYISRSDLDEVDRSVASCEPEQALFAEHEGMAIYEKIARQARADKIYLEIGYKQGKAVAELFSKAFPDKKVQVHKDIFGKERMVSIG